MRNRLSTAVLLLFILACSALPTTSHATKKCDRAIRKAERKCNCTLTAKPNDEGGRRSKNKKTKKFVGGGGSTYDPNIGMTYTRKYVEIDSTTEPPTYEYGSLITTIKRNGDSSTIDIIRGDTTVTEFLKTVTVNTDGDTVIKRYTVEDGDYIDSSVVVIKKQSQEEDGYQDEDERRNSRSDLTHPTITGSDTVDVGGMTVPIGTYIRDGATDENMEPFIMTIFKACTDITKVEILDLPTSDPNHHRHLIVVTGEWDSDILQRTILKWSRITRKAPRG